MNIIFMGTPDFAVPTLQSLIKSKHQVKAVFTQKPKPQGRGLIEEKSPIHELASQNYIQVYTPVSLRTQEVTDLINSVEADIIVVIAYGFIVPIALLQAKKYGCLNIHPSKLPRHRGAAPLQRTIIEGDTDSAVCIMKMDEGLDTGNILLQQEFQLSPRMTFQQLHDKCAILGADLLLQTLEKIDDLPEIIQRNIGISHAAKLKKQEGEINWLESAYKIDCRIRGMTPWPGVYFKYKNKTIKILEADYDEKDHAAAPGTVLNRPLDKLEIACGSGSLIIKRLQQEGKKTLDVEEFMRGAKVLTGELLN